MPETNKVVATLLVIGIFSSLVLGGVIDLAFAIILCLLVLLVIWKIKR